MIAVKCTRRIRSILSSVAGCWARRSSFVLAIGLVVTPSADAGFKITIPNVPDITKPLLEKVTVPLYESLPRRQAIRRQEEAQRTAYRPSGRTKAPPQAGGMPINPQIGTALAYIPRRLGVTLQTVDLGGGELALQLVTVTPGGAAHRAGLEPGDIITFMDSQRVRQPQELIQALTSTPITPSLTVRNVRDGQYISVRPSSD